MPLQASFEVFTIINKSLKRELTRCKGVSKDCIKLLQIHRYSISSPSYLMHIYLSFIKPGLQNEETEIQTLELELAKVQAEQNSLPTLISEVKALLKVEQQAAQEEADGIATRESSQDKVLSEIRSTLFMYKERLGLSLQQNRDNGSLAIGFRHVNQEHPEQEFTVTVRILEDNLFQVLSCEPKVDALQDLVDTLNADNDFATFIRNIRRAFVDSIKS